MNNDITVTELVKQLDLDLPGYYKNDLYYINIPDSDEFAKIYTKLDNNEKLSSDYTKSLYNANLSILFYYVKDSDYILKLVGDFYKDKYYIIVEEKKDN